MKLKLDPFSQSGFSVVQQTIVTGGGSSTSGTSQDPVTLAGEDYLSLSGQQITANAIDLDNLSATGTPDNTKFLRGDNTWSTPAGSGDVVGPASSTDNTIARFKGTTGKEIDEPSSNMPTISDDGVLTVPNYLVTSYIESEAPGANLDLQARHGSVGSPNGGSVRYYAGDADYTSGLGVGGDIEFSPGEGPAANGITRFYSEVLIADGPLNMNNNDITGVGTVDGRDISTDGTKLDGIEALADVTDATNVDAAGATMNADTSLVGNGYFLDEDDMASNSASKVPSQQSVKAYVDGAVASGVSDGDKGDITVSGSGATWTIDNDVVTYAKMQNVSATSRLLGRITASAGDVEELTAANVRTIINVADGATAYTDELAQDAVGGILDDTSEIALAYNDATPSITASLVAGSIDETKLDASVNASLDLADSAVQDLADLSITATASELNTLDGITASTAELNFTDGVTSAIQTQLDGKQPLDADLTTLSTAFASASASGPASLSLAEDTDNGSHRAIITAPASMAADRTITLPDASTTLVGTGTTDTLTTKTIDLGSNTITGTTAQFNTALSDNDFATLAGAETLSNKTLTAPKFADLGFIADANGNELIVMDTVGSAVPYVRVANAATGGVVAISADGETNQHIAVTGKGNGLTKISMLRQDNTTNAYNHNSILLSGWGVITIATGANNWSETVTFGITFAQRPIVVVSCGGDALTASGSAYGTGGNAVVGAWSCKGHTVTTTTFVAHLHTSAGANAGANGFVWYQWIAAGEL